MPTLERERERERKGERVRWKKKGKKDSCLTKKFREIKNLLLDSLFLIHSPLDCIEYEHFLQIKPSLHNSTG